MTKSVVRIAVAAAIGELTGSPPDRIDDADHLFEDLGVDSMASVNLLIAIEDRLGLRVPEGAEGSLVGVRTVGDLVACLISVFRLEVAESSVSAGS